MFSPLIVVFAVASASSSITALEECLCHSFDVDNSDIVCDDPSLTSIPDCVADNITTLLITTPNIPLVADTIRRFTTLQSLGIESFDNPQISKTFLSGQPNISLFIISVTLLDYVDSDWFLYAPRIRELFLNANKIVSLASDTFSSLALLEVVDLSYNQLTTLPATLFEGSALSSLGLSGNPWNCDCNLATFVQWTRDHGEPIRGQAICVQPPELAGLNLTDLTLDLVCKI